MKALQMSNYGVPQEVVELVDLPEPEAPRADDVLAAVEYAPINHSEILKIIRRYPLLPASLPAGVGNEGVARILSVGRAVTGLKPGDRVIVPPTHSAWRERVVLPAAGLFALPGGADPRQLSMLSINPPTAALLLSEYVDLKPGEWVVQNAANSGVGRWVIAFAKRRGLKTVNIVRRPELVPELEAIGGDLVVVDSPDISERIKTAVGQAELRLALDGVSGPATGVLAATLSPRGTLVSFAAMSSNPMSISPLDVIFKPVTVRGFFMAHPEFAAKLAPAAAQAAEMIASGRMHIPVTATYPLSSIKEAVAHAERGGKILLDIAGSST